MVTYKIGVIDDDEGMILQIQNLKGTKPFNIGTEEYKLDIVSINLDADLNEVIRQVEENHLDALLVDYRLKDRCRFISYQGIDIVEYFEVNKPFYPVFLLTGHSDQAEQQVIDVTKIFDREEYLGNQQPALNNKIVRQIESYKKRLEDATKRLMELNHKNTLTSSEEEEMIRLDHLIESSISINNTTNQLLKPSSFSKGLSDLIQKTEKLLKEIECGQ